MNLLKKTICLIMVFALILCSMQVFANEDEIMLISQGPTSEFADMDKSHFAYEAVANLYKNGFVSGDETGTIRPEQGITREETAKLALSINKVEVEQQLTVDAPDSNAVSHWAKDIVATAYKYGVLHGDETGTIRPQDMVTRAEMVAIIIRALNVQVEDAATKFSDVSDEDWCASYIDAASELGIVKGYEDGTFKPENIITRAEAFVIFNRVLTLRTFLENA